MKRVIILSLISLMILNNSALSSEKEPKISNQPFLSAQETKPKKCTIRKDNNCVCTTISLTIMAAILASGFGLGVYEMVKGFNHSHNSPSYFCRDDADMMQHGDLMSTKGIKITATNVKGFNWQWDHVIPFPKNSFKNNQEAKAYAIQAIRQACPQIFNSTSFCFEIDNLDDDQLMFSDVLTYCKKACHKNDPLRNTRNKLTRSNNVQRNNTTTQPKHQKQNFRQHMRGKNKRG